ncbi:MAG TPA: nitrate- and nitrite sensing domain-containing protein [Trebonia sp.]|nr:nitrate- and nitrite sensing domain-containing protein [Trebonia sp.]
MRSGSAEQEAGRGPARLVPQGDGYADYVDPARVPGPGQHRSGRRPPGQRPTRNIPTGSFRIKGVPVSANRRRQRSIRSTIAWLLVLPLLTMAGLYAYAAYGAIGSAVASQHAASVNNQVNEPVRTLGAALQDERAQTLAYQASSGRAIPLADLRAGYARTDAAAAAFEAADKKASGIEPATVRPEAIALESQLASLTGIRAGVEAGSHDGIGTFEQYNAVLGAVIPYVISLQNPSTSVPAYQESQAQVYGGEGIESAAEVDALLGGALAGGGTLTTQEYAQFASAYEDQKAEFANATIPLYWQVSTDTYQAALASPQYQALTTLEDQVTAHGPGHLPVTGPELQRVTGTVLDSNGPLITAEVASGAATSAADSRQGDLILYRLYAIGGAGLLVVIVSAWLLLRFGGRIARELTGLRGVAQAVAGERLPAVVRRLRAGDDVDVSAEAPPLDLGTKTREVTETADALSVLQYAAVEAAVEQARLRTGVSNVFRSLARRNQSLVQRQLRMLDEMERGTQDPDALSQLFRLDHLTTRMRRQAEGLIILSGAAPGRRWQHPVPVVEVLRGAVSEIEDYVRVDLVTDSPDYLSGTAVADVTHLLAELIENAVAYSPPATRVQVRAGRVASGYVVEVEDRGLGILPATRDGLNERLAQPPEFDLADSDQLGLFVVSRLAVRHGISVSLRESGFGGTTAIALLPPDLVVSQEEAAAAAREAPGAGAPSRRVTGATGGTGPVSAIGASSAGTSAGGTSAGEAAGRRAGRLGDPGGLAGPGSGTGPARVFPAGPAYDPADAGSGYAGSANADPAYAGAGYEGPGSARSGYAGPANADPAYVNSGFEGPGLAGFGRAGSAFAGGAPEGADHAYGDSAGRAFAGSGHERPGFAGSGNDGPGHVGRPGSASGHADRGFAGSGPDGPAIGGRAFAGSGRDDPGYAGRAASASDHASNGYAGPANAGSAQGDLAQPGPAEAVPARASGPFGDDPFVRDRFAGNGYASEGTLGGGYSGPVRSRPANGGRGSFGHPAPFQDAPAPGRPPVPPAPAAQPSFPVNLAGDGLAASDLAGSDLAGDLAADSPAGASLAGDGGGQAAGVAGGGLPRRQKMASMAPQLRDSRPGAGDGARGGRSPEQARALLSSIQRGLRTGREAEGGPAEGGPAEGSLAGPGAGDHGPEPQGPGGWPDGNGNTR